MNLPKTNLSFLLTDEMIKRASAMFDIEEATLTHLNDMGLLNTEYIRNAIILQDYERLTKGLTYLIDGSASYTFGEVKKSIAAKYNLTEHQITKIVSHPSRQGLFFCTKCGKIMKASEYKRTGGVCPECFVKTIIV